MWIRLNYQFKIFPPLFMPKITYHQLFLLLYFLNFKSFFFLIYLLEVIEEVIILQLLVHLFCSFYFIKYWLFIFIFLAFLSKKFIEAGCVFNFKFDCEKNVKKKVELLVAPISVRVEIMCDTIIKSEKKEVTRVDTKQKRKCWMIFFHHFFYS